MTLDGEDGVRFRLASAASGLNITLETGEEIGLNEEVLDEIEVARDAAKRALVKSMDERVREDVERMIDKYDSHPDE